MQDGVGLFAPTVKLVYCVTVSLSAVGWLALCAHSKPHSLLKPASCS